MKTTQEVKRLGALHSIPNPLRQQRQHEQQNQKFAILPTGIMEIMQQQQQQFRFRQ